MDNPAQYLKTDKDEIDSLVKKFFDAFTNKRASPNLNLLYETCMDKATIIKNTKGIGEFFDLQSFIAPRVELLTNGTLLEFEEYEAQEKTVITRNIAQRIAQYQKEGILNGQKFLARGTKMFQFVKTESQWKICNVIWDDEDL